MMKRYSVFLAFAVATSMVTMPVSADVRRTDQEAARAQMKSGKSKSSTEIIRNVRTQMKGMEYLGFKFDQRTNTYQLRFLDRNKSTRKSRVVLVNVDARSGVILSRR